MPLLIFCTCPDADVAERLARELVSAKLAACVNILPGVRSVYAWQGAIESVGEHLLLIKSHRERYAELEALLKQLHPYDVPEIIALPIERGSADYLNWMNSCLAIV